MVGGRCRSREKSAGDRRVVMAPPDALATGRAVGELKPRSSLWGVCFVVLKRSLQSHCRGEPIAKNRGFWKEIRSLGTGGVGVVLNALSGQRGLGAPL